MERASVNDYRPVYSGAGTERATEDQVTTHVRAVALRSSGTDRSDLCPPELQIMNVEAKQAAERTGAMVGEARRAVIIQQAIDTATAKLREDNKALVRELQKHIEREQQLAKSTSLEAKQAWEERKADINSDPSNFQVADHEGDYFVAGYDAATAKLREKLDQERKSSREALGTWGTE